MYVIVRYDVGLEFFYTHNPNAFDEYQTKLCIFFSIPICYSFFLVLFVLFSLTSSVDVSIVNQLMIIGFVASILPPYSIQSNQLVNECLFELLSLCFVVCLLI